MCNKHTLGHAFMHTYILEGHCCDVVELEEVMENELEKAEFHMLQCIGVK